MNEAMYVGELMSHYAERAGKIRAEQIEMLAAAFIKLTNLPPDQCELVEAWEGTKLTWHFRQRGHGDPAYLQLFKQFDEEVGKTQKLQAENADLRAQLAKHDEIARRVVEEGGLPKPVYGAPFRPAWDAYLRGDKEGMRKALGLRQPACEDEMVGREKVRQAFLRLGAEFAEAMVNADEYEVHTQTDEIGNYRGQHFTIDGVLWLPTLTTDHKTLMRRADDMLAEAKSAGIGELGAAQKPAAAQPMAFIMDEATELPADYWDNLKAMQSCTCKSLLAGHEPGCQHGGKP